MLTVTQQTLSYAAATWAPYGAQELDRVRQQTPGTEASGRSTSLDPAVVNHVRPGSAPAEQTGEAADGSGARPARHDPDAAGADDLQPITARDEDDETQSATSEDKKTKEAEGEEVRRLKARDAEVRAHEAAHAAAGGELAGAPSFKFERGPDGVNYAVSGEVPIDVSPVSGDPDATIMKMQQVKRAALAPANPSGADHSIAASADAAINSARQELAANGGKGQDTDQAEGTDGTGSPREPAAGSSTTRANQSDEDPQQASDGSVPVAGELARDALDAFKRRSGSATYSVPRLPDAIGVSVSFGA